MNNHSFYRHLSIAAALIVFVVSPLVHAQYTELHNFNWHAEGANPNAPALLAQGLDGSLYGTLQTQLSHDGSVFSCAPDGTLLDLYDFLGKPDGNNPQSGLTLGWDGNLYGTTVRGGTSDSGTVFKYRDGVTTVLYSFTNSTDGAYPWVPPIQLPDGNLYGLTYNGTSPGRAYKLNPTTGAYTVIAVVPNQTTSPLILGTDGNMYGTTPAGGASGLGTVFQLTTKGKLKIIHSFSSSAGEGQRPAAPVMQAADGKLYGTTAWGGANSNGTVYVMSMSGGGYKTLHDFQTLDGKNSSSGLVQGSDGFLYGAALTGGANSLGTLFKVDTKGKSFQKLWDFSNIIPGQSGDSPMSTPTLHTNGIIYGTTNHGGTQFPPYGVLYSYNAGLKPFVSLVVITSGYTNNAVGIIGQGFSTATGVSFGNGPGQIIPINDTAAIVVPLTGAMTGRIKVHEPSGDLVTPQTFKLLPSISDFSPKSGPVGTVITITGTSFKQTKSITVGKAVTASFTVVSDTQLTVAVPPGAVTGKITVKTLGGSVTAKGTFTVQ